VNNLSIPTIRILLVDDYQTMLWGLAKLIQGESPHMQIVGIASSLNETISGLHLHHPDVVLLDDDLEGEKITDILPQLVALGRHRILVLTSEQYATEFIQQLIVLGASGVVSKDAPAEQLLSVIESISR
jgi:two-component system nitrate/nitrite response regulator NarL